MEKKKREKVLEHTGFREKITILTFAFIFLFRYQPFVTLKDVLKRKFHTILFKTLSSVIKFQFNMSWCFD